MSTGGSALETKYLFFNFSACLISRDAGHLSKMRDCPARRGTVDRFRLPRAATFIEYRVAVFADGDARSRDSVFVHVGRDDFIDSPHVNCQSNVACRRTRVMSPGQ